MGRIPETLPGRSPAEKVYFAWRSRQRAPERCKLTEARRKLIRRALRDYEVEEVVALIVYAYEADEPGPRYWRGDNRQGRTYLDLTNLLSDAARLPGRVEAALAWVESDGAGEPIEDPTAMLSALANRAPGATTTATEETPPSTPRRRRALPRWE